MVKKIFGEKFRTLQPKVFISNFFDSHTVGNLGTLIYTSQRLKLFYRIGPWLPVTKVCASKAPTDFYNLAMSQVSYPTYIKLPVLLKP